MDVAQRPWFGMDISGLTLRAAAVGITLLALTASNAEGQIPAEAQAELLSKAYVYPRGNVGVIQLKVKGADAVQFDVDGWLSKSVPVRDGLAEYGVVTSQLRTGDYHICALLLRNGQGVKSLRYPFTVGRPHDKERMPVWKWGFGLADYQAEYLRCGYTGGWLLPIRALEGHRSARDLLPGYYSLSFEEAARNDFELGVHLAPLFGEEVKSLKDTFGTLPDGKKAGEVYPLSPYVMAYCRNLAESVMAAYSEFPAFRHALLSSEYETPMVLHPEAIRLAQKEIGLDITKLAFGPGNQNRGKIKVPPEAEFKDGIIPDDQPEYRFLKWWWERGHGTSAVDSEMASVIKQHRPDVITWNEPYRLAPVRKSSTGLDMIGTWTYGWPDIKRLCYTTYLQAAARPEGQKVQQDVTLFLYGQMAIPLKESTARFDADFSGKDPYFNVEPDYVREALWLVVSQRPDCIALYNSGWIDPLDLTEVDPTVASPETFSAIGEISRFLIQPYGPAVLDCERYKADVAVLASAVATWFPVGEVLPGYPCEQTLPYATLLMQNHVPFDVLLDDDIIEGRLKEYKVLVMPVAGTLTRMMVDRIKAFAADGGRVIANEPFRIREIPATVTDFSFKHQDLMSGSVDETKRVKADEDRRIMVQYARTLAPLLREVPRPATAESLTVLTNTLVSGDVTYHFFINDERTYGPRFGTYRLRQELGVPQSAKVRVALANRPALYDASRRVPVKYESKNGFAEFEVHLPAARGKLIAALPEPIQGVQIEAPASVAPGETVTLRLRVLGKSGKTFCGSLPLKVSITDPLGRSSEYSRYTTTRRAAQGECVFTFTVAVNDEPGAWEVTVRDMIGGTTARTTIKCSPAK